LLHADFCPPHQRPTAGRGARVFPNATGKAKGERAVFVGDQLLEDRDLSSLALRRPLDRRGPAPLARRCPGRVRQRSRPPRSSGSPTEEEETPRVPWSCLQGPPQRPRRARLPVRSSRAFEGVRCATGATW